MATDTSGEGVPGRFPEFAADAVRYWEPRRLIYNTVLFAVVCVHVMARWPAARAQLTRDHVLVFFMLAVLANVVYCAAYAVDLFAQYSELGEPWSRRRWILLLVGTAFAATLTHFFTLALVGEPYRG